MRPLLILAVLWFILTSTEIAAADPITLYVAPHGDDQQPGTAEEPFATPQRARDIAREINQPVTIRFADGTYSLSEPFVLSPADSGSAESPIVYEAAPGATPLFTGGHAVTGWQETMVMGRKLWTVEIPEVREGKAYFHQLWVNGERRTRARHPNEGVLRIAELPGVTPQTPRYPGQKQFRYAEGDLQAFDNLKDVEVIVLHLWVAVRMAIEDIDEENRLVTFAKESRRTLKDGNELARYYVENALALLDAPGEWYLDRASGMLYYMPLPGERIDEVEALFPTLPHVLRFDGHPEKGEFVEHITLRGLTFAHAEWWPARTDTADTQANAEALAVIQGDGVRHCTIEDCTIRHASGYGIHLARGCAHNHLTGCEVRDLGAGGIRIGEMAIRDNEDEQSHSNRVSENHLHKLGLIFHQAVGVWIGQSYANRIDHNHIHDLFYTGISCGWTWGYGKTLTRDNIIEHNHVHDIGKGLLSDMGGIYTLGMQPGTIIRHNVFHDIDAYHYGGWGIYFDEGSTNIVAEKNLVYRTKHGGFHQHYGRENIVRHNIFAFGREAQIRRSRLEDHLSFTFEHNIVYWDSGKLLDGNWSELRVAFDHNLYWHVGGGEINFAGMSFAKWQQKGMDEHSLIADPLFVDPENADFRLREASPALKFLDGDTRGE